MTTKSVTTESNLELSPDKVKWNVKGFVVGLAAVVVIGIGAVMYFGSKGNTVEVSGRDGMASGSGDVRRTTVTGGGAVTEHGNATDQSVHQDRKYSATATGPGGTAHASDNINVDAKEVIDAGAVEDLLKKEPGSILEWKSDERGQYIAFPFEPRRISKISPALSTKPFEGNNRRAVAEVHNVTPAWAQRISFQVKAERALEDENRQAGNAAVGQEFTILRKMEGDLSFYLASRMGDNKTVRHQFLEDNPKAVIVIRLLD
jgi:hypothetical protein